MQKLLCKQHDFMMYVQLWKYQVDSFKETTFKNEDSWGGIHIDERAQKFFEVQFSGALTYITSNFLSESYHNYDSILNMSPGRLILRTLFIETFLLNLKNRNIIIPYSPLLYSDPGRHSTLEWKEIITSSLGIQLISQHSTHMGRCTE